MRAADVEAALANQSDRSIKTWTANIGQIPCPAPVGAGGIQTRVVQVAQVVAGKAAARSWRVTFGALNMIADPVDPQIGAEVIPAILEWGWDGAKFSAEIDWPVRGGHVDLWGDTVTVSIRLPSAFQHDPARGSSPLDTSVQAMAAILPSAPGGGIRPTRTYYTGVLQAGGGSVAVIPVPAFARSVKYEQVINLDPTNAPVAIDFVGSQQDGAIPTAYVTQSYPSGVLTSAPTSAPADGIALNALTRYTRWSTGTAVATDLTLSVVYQIDL